MLRSCGTVDSLRLAARLHRSTAMTPRRCPLLSTGRRSAIVSHHLWRRHKEAVEKREPFRCGVWQIAPNVLDQAQGENEEAMRDLKRCRETGDWFLRWLERSRERA